MNETNLFNAIRSITVDKKLSQIQVDSINAILEACTKYSITDIRHIAYILATAYHESRFKPIEEIGHGMGRAYGAPIRGKVYFGRGFVQLTWLDNYKSFGQKLGIDLVNSPELALNVKYAADIIVLGMKQGSFTGAALNKYFNEHSTDAINARRIVNGIDCANLIAGYYSHIIEGLK